MKKIKETIKNELSTNESYNYASRMTCLMFELISYITAFVIMIDLLIVIIKDYKIMSENLLRGIIVELVILIAVVILLLLGNWLGKIYKKIKTYSKEK